MLFSFSYLYKFLIGKLIKYDKFGFRMELIQGCYSGKIHTFLFFPSFIYISIFQKNLNHISVELI